MAVQEILAEIRRRRPLVHCLTNAVTIGRVADALAALGAVPVMASAPEELADMVDQAQALVLNLGTPRTERFVAARSAAERARAHRIPVVLDPVGCGATAWRTGKTVSLLQRIHPQVIRGNAPEIAVLAGSTAVGRLRGVTADRCGQVSGDVARYAGRTLGAVMVVTGDPDVVSDGERCSTFAADVGVLARVVGAGDVLTAIVGACCAVEGDAFVAACAALDLFGVAARHAAHLGAGPGTFWPRLVDCLGVVDPNGSCPVTAPPVAAAVE